MFFIPLRRHISVIFWDVNLLWKSPMDEISPLVVKLKEFNESINQKETSLIEIAVTPY